MRFLESGSTRGPAPSYGDDYPPAASGVRSGSTRGLAPSYRDDYPPAASGVRPCRSASVREVSSAFT
jgi:hypothetical protein